MIKKIKCFFRGFTSAFTPVDNDLLHGGGYYMRNVSDKRKEKLVVYEKNRNNKSSK